MNINLLPWRKQYRHQQQILFYVTNLLCIMTAIIWIAMHHMFINIRLSNQVKTNLYLTKVLHAYDKKLLPVNKVRQSITNKLDNIQFIKNLQNENYTLISFISKLNLLLPQAVYITYLKFEKNAITILGRAKINTDIATFMQNVSGYKFISNPKLSEFINDIDSQYKQNFQLQFRILTHLGNKEVEVRDLKN